MRARCDSRIAVTATAHKLARLIYHMFKYGEEYIDMGAEQYEARFRVGMIKALERKARRLGFQLVATS